MSIDPSHVVGAAASRSSVYFSSGARMEVESQTKPNRPCGVVGPKTGKKVYHKTGLRKGDHIERNLFELGTYPSVASLTSIHSKPLPVLCQSIESFKKNAGIPPRSFASLSVVDTQHSVVTPTIMICETAPLMRV
jgi:hypothetical protein